MEFTVVDAGVGAIVLISGVLAYSRGFTRELFAIAGWIIAAIAAFFAAPMLKPIILEAPVVGPFLARSCVVSIIAAFTIIVALVLLLLSVFNPLISGLVLDSALGPIDRMLGFVFGVVRGLLLVAIAYLIYINLSGIEAWPPLDNAASRTVFEESATMLEQNLPQNIPDWLSVRIDALMASCPDQLPSVTSPAEGTVGGGTGEAATGATGTTSTETTGNTGSGN